MRPTKIQTSIAQADLNLRWAHKAEGTFIDAVAHIKQYNSLCDAKNGKKANN